MGKIILFVGILCLITACSDKPKKKLQRCSWQPLAYACGGTETHWVDPQSWFDGWRSTSRSQGLD